MHIILRYPTRRRVEAVLLSATADRMRVVVRNQNDALELHRTGDQWVSDRGSAVEIESLVADDPCAVERLWTQPRARTNRAAC